jgi:hypothetical protein
MEVAVVLTRRNVKMIGDFYRVLLVISPHINVESAIFLVGCVDPDVGASTLVCHTVRRVIISRLWVSLVTSSRVSIAVARGTVLVGTKARVDAGRVVDVRAAGLHSG